jgi:hypothetical protein
MQPLNLGETLDASIKIAGSRWRTLATVMLVIALPIQLANIITIKLTTDVYEIGTSFSSTSDTATTYGDEGSYIAGQTAMIAMTFLGYLLGTVACYRVIVEAYLGRETSAREALGYAGSRLGATLLLAILLAVGVVAGFIAFIVPGIWLWIAWSVAYPVLFVEGTGGAGALRRSLKLVQSRWWATAARMGVAYILAGVVALAAGVLFLAPTEIIADTSFGALILEHVANLAALVATTPFVAAVTTLVYFDLRVRKEGFDPALQVDGAGEPAFSAPAVPTVPTAPPSAPPPLWSSRPEGDRDAFGRPAAPREAPGAYAPPVPPDAPAPSEPGAGAWAPPVAPEPKRAPTQDE